MKVQIAVQIGKSLKVMVSVPASIVIMILSLLV